MSDALDQYRTLQARLIALRRRYDGYEAPQEEALLEEMTAVWLRLTASERQGIEAEGPVTLIRTHDGSPVQRYQHLEAVWLRMRADPAVTEVQRDAHLDAMDVVWDQLTEAERSEVSRSQRR